jgi:hypothetical protein
MIKMSYDKRNGESHIRVGNIQNSTGVAIGNGARATVNQSHPSEREEVDILLDDFIRSLGLYNDSLADPQGVRESAVEARAEVARPSPKWLAVRRMLTRVSAGVAGVAALTDAINNIQSLVARIIN